MAHPNDKKLSEYIRDNVRLIKQVSPDINYFISRLQTTSNRGVAIFGGAVRDWWLGYEPKDVDIVIDTDYFKDALDGIVSSDPLINNAFDGRVFTLSGVKFDVWNLRDTHAFKKKQFEPSWENLVRSVPFNVDSVLVMLTGEVYEHRFWSGISNQEIDFVNKIHAEPKFIAQRARTFASKYGFKLSGELEKFAHDQLGDVVVDDILQVDLTTGKSLRSSNHPVLLDVDGFPF